MGSCFAYQKGLVKELTVKINKTKVRERDLHYLVIRCGENWVWKKRRSGDIWEGLHDFPLSDSEQLSLPQLSEGQPRQYPKKYRHILSHQRLNASFSEVEIPQEKQTELYKWCENEGYMLVSEKEIEYLAKPKLIVNFLKDQGI